MMTSTRILSLFFLFFLLSEFPKIQAQDSVELLKIIYEGMPFEDLESRAESYFNRNGRGKGSGWKQYERWQFLRSFECDENGRLQTGSSLQVWKTIERRARLMSATGRDVPVNNGNMSWRSLAPTHYTPVGVTNNPGLGRVNTVAFHPDDPNVLFAGTPAGGIWKSTDAGLTWTPLMDFFAHIGVQDIAIHPENPDTMYVMTGDGDMEHTYSIGVIKTYDGGTTWQTTGLTYDYTNIRGFRIVLHPTNPDTMFATFLGGSRGIQMSTDGGDNWSQVLSCNCYDFEIKPDDPSIMYASDFNGVYRSVDIGQTWTQIDSGLPSSATRVELAVSPAEPDYVYALYGGSNAYGSGTFKGLFRSEDAGISFDTMSTTPNIMTINISYRCLALDVHPLYADSLVTGSYRVYRSGDGGVTHALAMNNGDYNADNYVHVDIHELKYQPGTNRLYCSNDGGIWVSENNGVAWTDLTPGMQTMQFYRIASSMNNPNTILGGTQDNGTSLWVGSGSHVYNILGADGMDCMADHDDPNILYYSFQNGNMYRSYDAGMSGGANIKPPGASGGWLLPWKMNPLNSRSIFAGYANGVYKSTDRGETWDTLGVKAKNHLVVSPADTNRIYAAHSKELFTTNNLGITWDTISTNGLPNSNIAGIAVSSNDANELYVIYGGNLSSGKIYQSTDAGLSWNDFSGTGLPALPLNSIVFQDDFGVLNEGIYVGTVAGIYYRDSTTGLTWEYVSENLPNAPIMDMDINYSNYTIRAGTYGRGLWESDLYGAGCPAFPQARCQPVSVTLDSTGLAEIVTFQVDNGSYDQCGIDSMSLEPSTMTCSDIGVGTVVLTVYDQQGNTDTCHAQISVGILPVSGVRIWSGALDTNWCDPCNWEGFSVPGAQHDVLITGPVKAVISDTVCAAALSVVVDSAAQLVIDATASMIVDGALDAGVSVTGSLANQGSLTIRTAEVIGGAAIENSGSINNTGTMQLSTRDAAIVNLTGTYTNAGLVTIGEDMFIPSIAIENFGTFINDAGILEISNSDFNGIINRGIFSNQNSALIRLGQDGEIFLNGISNQDTAAIFRNDNSIIQIDNTEDNGIRHRKGTFENVNGGQILIGQNEGNIGKYGINNRNTDTIFKNDGSGSVIRISSSVLEAIQVANGAVFENLNGAEVILQH